MEYLNNLNNTRRVKDSPSGRMEDNMAYLVQRRTDLKFLAKKGSLHSYTFNILNVKFFQTKEEAEKEKLQEEIVVSVFNL